ncbi:hypothetical protein BJF78_28265 [Pseudonocardia sp. CNS-139]|nr:hypothetical protein BJF78_28265 [Pseudonocardia sp. CNS-139]
MLVAGVVAGVALLVLPDLAGLDRFTPFAQVVSFRPYTLAGLAPVVLLLSWLAVRRWRTLRPLAALLVTVVVVGAALVLPRAVPVVGAQGVSTADGRTLTVVAFNTLSGNADIEAVADLVRTERPDLVSLVEAGRSYRSRLAPLVEPLGYRLHTSVGPDGGDLSGVTALVAGSLGAVDVTDYPHTPFPSVELSGGNLGSLRFVAFHSLAPRRGDVPQWHSDVAGVARWCAGPGPAIVAGDFNATFDHSVFRSATAGCSDAAAQRGQGLAPTWPTWLPDWIGPQIDHVLATDPITAEAFSLREVPGSDHRAVIARLRVPG